MKSDIIVLSVLGNLKFLFSISNRVNNIFLSLEMLLFKVCLCYLVSYGREYRSLCLEHLLFCFGLIFSP